MLLCRQAGRLLCVMLLLGGASAWAVCPSDRITVEPTVKAADYPWAAMLRRDKQLICGGVLIRPDLVLTAAHCLAGGAASAAKPLEVVAGPAGEVRQVSRQAVEPRFRGLAEDGGDLAMLWLDKPVSFEGGLPVPATKEQVDDLVRQGRCARVLGWGSNKAKAPGAARDTGFIPALRTALLPLQTQAECHRVNRGLVVDQMCAGDGKGGPDACTGDSGGPLVVWQDRQWLLIGLVSWGRGCAASGEYGVYTHVGRHHAWILEKEAE